MRSHAVARSILTGLAVMAASGGLAVSNIARASASAAEVACAPSTLRLSYTSDTSSQGWLPSTLFLGYLHFATTDTTCYLPVGHVTLRAEVGTVSRHTPLGTASSRVIRALSQVTRGGSLTIFVMVSGTPPKGWKSGTPCAPSQVVGLLVSGGPAKIWRNHFVPFAKPRSVCGAYHLSA